MITHFWGDPNQIQWESRHRHLSKQLSLSTRLDMIGQLLVHLHPDKYISAKVCIDTLSTAVWTLEE